MINKEIHLDHAGKIMASITRICTDVIDKVAGRKLSPKEISDRVSHESYGYMEILKIDGKKVLEVCRPEINDSGKLSIKYRVLVELPDDL